jgi:hypothetical protein
LYTIFEQQTVVLAIGEAYLTFPRFHDLYDALTWRLARDPYPEAAVQLAPDTYLIKSANWRYEGLCVIKLIYTVSSNSNEVCVEDFRAEANTP